jgi:D-alanine-D-alanine ligase-like ATP-grasp enzyme
MNRLVKFVTYPIRKLVRLLAGKPKGNPNASWNFLLEVLSLCKIVRFESSPASDALHPRSGIFFDEAKARGLDIVAANILGKRYTDDFRFSWNGKRYYYEAIPMTMFPNSIEMDNKFLAKSLLIANGFPVAKGKLFTDTDEAFAFGKSVGYPLVVKPNNGSLSNHVTCYIKTDEDFREAMCVAQEYSPAFIVEQAIVGNVYRGTVVGRKHVFVSQRDRANVVGDGTHTVQELLNIKNADEKRAAAFTTNASVHQVPVDEIALAYLASQNQSLEYVPGAGEKVYLYSNRKYVPDRGNDIINCTAVTHPENIEMFLDIAKMLDTELVGIDFIVADITKPHKEQQAAVLETNSLPFIDMHQFPSHGEGDPVAKLTWDLLLERLT